MLAGYHRLTTSSGVEASTQHSSSYEASLAPPQGMEVYYTDPSYSWRSVLVYLRWANGEPAPGDYPNVDTGRYCIRKIEGFMQHLD